MTASKKTQSNHRWKRLWVWVETTTGLSCIDVESIIAISNSTTPNYIDLHLSSGSIFTMQLADISSITDVLPDWKGAEV